MIARATAMVASLRHLRTIINRRGLSPLLAWLPDLKTCPAKSDFGKWRKFVHNPLAATNPIAK
jgi:hypothetical protein